MTRRTITKSFWALTGLWGAHFHLFTGLSWVVRSHEDGKINHFTRLCHMRLQAFDFRVISLGRLAHVLLVSANNLGSTVPQPSLARKSAFRGQGSPPSPWSHVLLSQTCFGSYFLLVTFGHLHTCCNYILSFLSKLIWTPHMRIYKQIQGKTHTHTNNTSM